MKRLALFVHQSILYAPELRVNVDTNVKEKESVFYSGDL